MNNVNVERIREGLNRLVLFGTSTWTGQKEIPIIRACLDALDVELREVTVNPKPSGVKDEEFGK
jgi:hypothetical protein